MEEMKSMERGTPDYLDEALKSPLEQTMRSTAYSEDGNVQISAIINTYINYALQQNHVAIIQAVAIKNAMLEALENVSIRIWTDVGAIEAYEEKLGILPAGEVRFFRRPKLILNGAFLSSITEQMTCVLRIALYSGEQVILQLNKEVDLYPFDFFPMQSPKDLLAAFVMPNHPVVKMLLQIAVKQLQEWGKEPSLEGYQAGDTERVLEMAAAAYAAIQKQNIFYSEPPRDFSIEQFQESHDMTRLVGQRVRLPDEIIETRLGTCLDLTLLYVSCLEAMGLNPFLVLEKGHIYAGVWLLEDAFEEAQMEEASQIENRFADGVSQVAVVECTMMCAGQSSSFEEAYDRAKVHVKLAEESFSCVIDINRARISGVNSLPIRRKDFGHYQVEHSERDDDQVTGPMTERKETIDLSYLDWHKKQVSKEDQWERKLLDLSRRNTLINMRPKSVVPLIVVDYSELEDMLSEDVEYEIVPCPKEWHLHGVNAWCFDTVNDMGQYRGLIEESAKKRKLHSIFIDELPQRMNKIYRGAKEAMEEKGANTLFLALGVLKWQERTGKYLQTHFAPIVLIPIDIYRKSASAPYVIHEREGAMINSTLLEFLRQKYELEIPGLTPSPTDEHGLDVKKIFAIVRNAIMEQSGWGVLEEAFIGNFSFERYAMWNDIHNHREFLKQNKIVQALISGAADWDRNISDLENGEDSFLPVSVDASQLRAVNMAASGQDFVLHGPPGTGKSQTITAMIANALTKGKTVLFVAEKEAALNVVQKRLNVLGIKDFCLELHSNKATKKEVLHQLNRGLENKYPGIKTDYEKKIEEIHKMRKHLDAYAKSLHDKRNCGLSFRELIEAYEAIPEQKASIRFSSDYAKGICKGDIETRTRLLGRLIEAGKQVGHPKGHPLSFIGRDEYSQSFRMQLEDLLDEYAHTIDSMQDAGNAFAKAIGDEAPISEEQWVELKGLAISFKNNSDVPGFLFNGEPIESVFQPAMKYASLLGQKDSQRKEFLTRYYESVLSVDLADISEQYEIAAQKLFRKSKAIENVAAKLQQHVRYDVEPEMIPMIIQEIEQYRQIVETCEKAKAELPEYWSPYLSDSLTVEKLATMRSAWEKQIDDLGRYVIISAQLKTSERYDIAEQKATTFSEISNRLQEQEDLLNELLISHAAADAQDWIRGKKEFVHVIMDNYIVLRDWISYQKVRTECEENGLREMCSAYEEGLEHEELIPAYLKAVYKALIRLVFDNEPGLNCFTGNTFNDQIRQYKEMEEQLICLTKEEMYYRLAHNLPKGNESADMMKEMAILRRAVRSGGRALSIRTLLENIPHVLPKLCPCMLMSPISVAQYLSADIEPFDIVIFDEASQMPTSEAVGVLARGKNAVIVGDPNQMPPTSFFTESITDDDNQDLEDLDSILDDCLALGMPETRLQWHYRSRHESLIAFSNQQYYENSMFTFPSVNDRERRVKLCTVNGVFNRKKGRINEREAQKVVKEILRRFNNAELSKDSIGVICFNISQQRLIADLLTEEYKKNPELDKWAHRSEEDGLFVKNLENSQGDERDVILFSIGYGPDEEGNLSMNFGPLNKEGGWKRLNVAVSRARKEMIVFSSMTADMIDIDRTKSRGVKGLHDFLAYAETGHLSDECPVASVESRGITKQICAAIEADGFKTQTDIGHSDFRVDIGVVNPYNEDEYLLGILLDGVSYGRAQNTKDREISQSSVLKSLGWHLHRIWTMDWWDNCEKELSSLRKKIEELAETARIAAEDKQQTDDEPQSEPITYTKNTPKQRKKQSKWDETGNKGGNTDFNKFDRFRPENPQADKELEDFLNEFQKKN